MIDIQPYKTLDEALFDSAKRVRTLHYVRPLNEPDEKKRFLSGETTKPRFKLRDLEYDTNEEEARLKALEVPEGRLSPIYEGSVRKLLLYNRLIREIAGRVIDGSNEVVRSITQEVNGTLDKQLIDYANQLLRQIPPEELPKVVPAEVIKKSLEDAIQEHGLDWTVGYSNSWATTMSPTKTKLTVCRHRDFAEIDPPRLRVHEVDGHALRSANGYEQDLKIFARGLPGYLPTEEGLTLYLEEITGNTSDEVMREYAARVIAVDSIAQNLDFKQTFDRLKDNKLTDEQAWTLTTRVHRGGGYNKSHVYLKGYKMFKEFMKDKTPEEQRKIFEKLYVGQIGVDDLPLVEELLQEGVLRKAKHFPKFLGE